MQCHLVSIALVLSLVTPLAAPQDLEAVLVEDINCRPAGKGADPAWLTPIGSLLYFSAYTELGTELWATDGTLAGTYLVKDIAPINSSDPTSLVALGNTLLFGAFEGTERELWRSDGTEDGTVRVRAIDPGLGLTVAGELLYFVANDGEHGAELWRSDGSEVGTAMVADLEPGPGPARIGELVDVDGTLYFTRRIGLSGSDFDLWRSDGTAAGTVLVAEFGPGSNSSLNRLTSVGGVLYFVAVTDNDRELWRHDPSTGATVEIEVNPLTGSFPNELTDVDGTLYFRASVGFDDELYRLDGDTPVRIRDINPGGNSSPQKLTPVSSGATTTLFFSADDGVHGRELWRTDGTEAGTVMVADIDPAGDGIVLQVFFDGIPDFADVNGTLFFAADDGSGREVWRSDGTEAGTLVLDVNPSGTSLPHWVVDLDGTACFIARSGEGEFTLHDLVFGLEVWVSDGTPVGTLPLDITPDRTLPSFALPQIVVGSTLYFLANHDEVLLPVNDGDDMPADYELWRSDGTRPGTFMVADINPLGSAFTRPAAFSFGELDGMLFFNADDGLTGRELWRSDGTAAGTELVLDIDPLDLAPDGSFPMDFTTIGEHVFFSAHDGVTGRELWRSDGTTEGTVQVADIDPGAGWSSPRNLVELGGILLFSASDGVAGTELWRSDGTTAGTELVRDLRPGAAGSFLRFFTGLGDTLFFNANGTLWRSDGTAGGTLQIPGLSGVGELATLDGWLYFAAAGDASGTELWRYDPVADAAERVSDANPTGSAYPSELTASDGVLFFAAYVAALASNERELWAFDPATGVAEPIARPDVPGDPGIGNLIDVGGTLYFTARAGSPPVKRPRFDLWRSDGTAAGTVKMDFGLPMSMTPLFLTDVDGTLFFTGFHFGTSTELFMLRGTPSLAITSPAEDAVIGGVEVLVEGIASDDREVASVSVNHVEATLTPTGNPDDPAEVFFSALVPLAAGENELTASAVDDDGHIVKASILVSSEQQPRPKHAPAAKP